MTFYTDPSQKYKRFDSKIKLENRKWPSKQLEKAPRWLATDLRDGNQSLPDPMNLEEKKLMLAKLCELGYKEIEVAFPSASNVDFQFTQYAVKNVPEDVSVQVLAPCREPLIERTVESLIGAKRATVHLYLATSPCFRDVVFNGMSREECISKAVKCTKLIRALTKDHPERQDTYWSYEFSPETFSDSEPEFVLEICEAVKAAWEPSVENPIIFNLPATVEMSTPNVYADQIENFANNISEREKVCISLHPHNDRGCAVAAAELGQLAGGDRVEGCLFGNGERTGNVDLVTLALNLYTQGIDPKLNYSDMESVIEVVEKCNKIPVHPRAPYGGQLVVCAFSGSHQDAIKKGFEKHDAGSKKLLAEKGPDAVLPWKMPYLPLDPQDIGRTYEAIIRVNSQSGKGGSSWVILKNLELDLPRDLQIAFSKIVQQESEVVGRELKSTELVSLFEKSYYVGSQADSGNFKLVDYKLDKSSTRTSLHVTLSDGSTQWELQGKGNGPISSFIDALNTTFNTHLDVKHYHEHSLGDSSDSKAATYISLSLDGFVQWGVGVHEDTTQASFLALLSSINGLDREGSFSADVASN